WEIEMCPRFTWREMRHILDFVALRVVAAAPSDMCVRICLGQHFMNRGSGAFRIVHEQRALPREPDHSGHSSSESPPDQELYDFAFQPICQSNIDPSMNISHLADATDYDKFITKGARRRRAHFRTMNASGRRPPR